MDDATFLEQFQTQTLPFDRWTHRAHVRVAYLYLSAHPFDTALERVRAGIKAYNAANQVPEGPYVGYHETMTHAYLRLVHTIVREYGPYENADAFIDDHPQFSKKQVLRLFYSKDRFMDPEAKTRFLEPDLAPLPEPRSGPS